jgi:hypothetical protein
VDARTGRLDHADERGVHLETRLSRDGSASGGEASV